MKLLNAQEAWAKLKSYKGTYYDELSALYSGNKQQLVQTASGGSFWNRKQKCRVHVPLAGEIASISADLLFGESPRIELFYDAVKQTEGAARDRLDYVLQENNLSALLNEAGETCAALGDVYLKINWNGEELDYPQLVMIQPDCVWAEYMLGKLEALHIFNPLNIDKEGRVTRVYECYQRGTIDAEVYAGTATELGKPVDGYFEQLGLEAHTDTPIDEMLAVHIPNVRPNRKFRSSMLGRSDLDGLRDLCDGLDEAYTSWLRDIRLAKAKTIVPAEFLRKRPASFDEGMQSQGYYEFDQDVETYVTMDIDPDRASNPITTSQFAIRANEHKDSCLNYIERIISSAGYSPQSFGLQINGMSTSGSALRIREKKSYATILKKQGYWKNPLEKILNALVHLDSVLYGKDGSIADSYVSVNFNDGWFDDIGTISNAVEQISRADAASLETKVKMLHPYWTEEQVQSEIDLIRSEQGLDIDNPIENDLLGDTEADV